MNLRPPGYEPGELPDCSTPRRGPDCSSLVTLVSMWEWAIWAALILVAGAGTAALALLVQRSLKAWRALRDTGGAILSGLDDFTAKAEAVADRIAAADNGSAEVQESLGRLRVSLARLAVLRAAIDDVDHMFGRVAAEVPHK